MKTLFASALIATAALTGAANASLSAAEVSTYAPNADVSALSAAEANMVVSILHSGSTESEKRNAIRKIVN